MRLIIFFLLILYPAILPAQEGFQWRSPKDKIVIPFVFVDNLIIIPVEINNAKLNMLLDSGSEPSLIFSFPQNDTIQLYNTKKIRISGLGSEEVAEGLLSQKNRLSVSEYVDTNFEILVILDEKLNFSSRIGIPVNGILGYSFFRNHLVEIDYQKKKITLYKNNDLLKKRRIKSFTAIPLDIVNGRPYINVNARLDEKEFQLKLLMDTGLTDGLWLFEDDKIKCNDKYFEDVLGEGIGGTIYGKKSRLSEITTAHFRFKEPLVSYPDTTSYKQLSIIKNRNGSLGGEILKRFNLIVDYGGKQLLVKKNKMFDDPFLYNMSGIEVQHNGVQWVQELKSEGNRNQPVGAVNIDDIVFDNSSFKYKFTLKPVFEIASVRKGSPAEEAGLKAGDKILRIERKNVYNLTKQRINELLQVEANKTVRIEVEREGKVLEYKVLIKKIF
ncbi:PDZ domain-containing protein [Flavobacterium cerinum]|uniref:PDZ domain-containing protein n=1 Tax=Flavobacterium cerinum TaxID=2502784 RepID=A0ABY5IQB2_9FLAO|nr:PDZ domain-containing protein [Flavobacterium cerinum]UUC45016.1 PDZ domain-containing protein [Flavobacterium cerinum]